MDVATGARVRYGHFKPLRAILRLKCDNVAKVTSIVVLWVNRLRAEQKSHTQGFFYIKSYRFKKKKKKTYMISKGKKYVMIDIHTKNKQSIPSM